MNLTNAQAVAGGLGATRAASRRSDSGWAGVPEEFRPGGSFERLLTDQAKRKGFSGAVLLARHGRPVFAEAYGWANEQERVPNRVGTRFSLASISKTLTAVAVVQLIARGEIEADATLGTYLGGFPDQIAEQVTVHHLLCHTGGIGRPPINPEPPPGSKEWDTVREVRDGNLAYIRGLPPRMTPGLRFDYSNDGYLVLAAIVEAVSGQTYDDYMRQHVFAAAGMRRTDLYTRPYVRSHDDVARWYMTGPSGERQDMISSEHFGFVGGPADGIYTTIGDMLRFVRALWDETLLDRAALELATSGKEPMPDREGALPNLYRCYGYGFFDAFVGNVRVLGHTGSGLGRNNNLDIFGDAEWVALVLGNSDADITPIVRAARAVLTR